MKRSVHSAFRVLLIIAFCGAARPAAAMSYSTWGYMSTDGSDAYAYSSVAGLDGCLDGVEYYYDEIHSPSRSSGSYGGAALSLNDEEGYWNSGGIVGVYCACGGHVMELGSGGTGGILASEDETIPYGFQDIYYHDGYNECRYDKCTSSFCGPSSFLDVRMISEECPGGALMYWRKKAFLGVPYWCSETQEHTHTADDPC